MHVGPASFTANIMFDLMWLQNQVIQQAFKSISFGSETPTKVAALDKKVLLMTEQDVDETMNQN